MFRIRRAKSPELDFLCGKGIALRWGGVIMPSVRIKAWYYGSHDRLEHSNPGEGVSGLQQSLYR
jgi:hypothetical protein